MENVIQLQNSSKTIRNASISLRDKVYLDCPFEEKELCKSVGGQWDPKSKKWFIPKGHHHSKFERWLTKTHEKKVVNAPEINTKFRNRNPLVTGPRMLLGVDDNDRTYLKLYFDDYPKIARKMAKGGSWPSVYAERLRTKAAELMEAKVYLKTSQHTTAWDPLKWVMDLIPATDWHRTKKVKDIVEGTTPEKIQDEQKIDVIPSKSYDDNQFCVFSGNQGLYLIFLDEIANSNLFDSPDTFDEFKKYVENCFEASYYSKKTARNMRGASTMSRIRIRAKNRSKRNGYRLVVSKVEQHQGISIFHAIHLDDKLLNEEFPTDREIKGFKEILNKCHANYGPEKLKNIINELGNSNV